MSKKMTNIEEEKMDMPLLHPDFNKDSLKAFIIACILALVVASIGFIVAVKTARAEDGIGVLREMLSAHKSDMLTDTQKWCEKLGVSQEDTKLLTAIILSHYAVGEPLRFANTDIGFASWIKMMRYLHDEAKDTRPLLDFCVEWCNRPWVNYTEKWKDKVKIFYIAPQ